MEAAERPHDLLHLVVAERAAVPGLEGGSDRAGDLGGEQVAGRASAHAALPGEGQRGDGAVLGGAWVTGGFLPPVEPSPSAQSVGWSVGSCEPSEPPGCPVPPIAAS